jgi:hypothetical protein
MIPSGKNSYYLSAVSFQQKTKIRFSAASKMALSQQR